MPGAPTPSSLLTRTVSSFLVEAVVAALAVVDDPLFEDAESSLEHDAPTTRTAATAAAARTRSQRSAMNVGHVGSPWWT